MVKTLSTLLAAASAVAFLAVGAAEAQTPKKPRVARVRAPSAVAELVAPPLVVKKRSFLDPGNTVPVGSETPEYIAANTTEVRPITATYAPAFFGESTLPGRFDLPNNPRFFPQRDLDFSPF